MQIEKIKIDAVRPYENNAKVHTPEQIAQIMESIMEFGNNDPIAVDENNVVIEGHGRLLALQQLGYKEVEVIRLTHLTNEQKRAYILVHNKLTVNTGFDFNILDAELAEITDIEMSDFGFDTVEVSPMDFNENFTLNASSVPLIRTLTLSLTPEQYAIWLRAIEAVRVEGLLHSSEKTSEQCNAIAEIVYQWAEARGINED